jgi:hypothetical protein
MSHTLNTKGVTEKFRTFSVIVKGKGPSRFDRMIWDRLMSNIYHNSVEIGVDLIA